MKMSIMLSVTVQYALKALSVLARLPEGGCLLGKELARRADIPANYLSKILWVLGGAGFIDATRGSGGGYRLQRPPREIRLAEIVDLFEHGRAPKSCFFECEAACVPSNGSSAARAWHEIDAAMKQFLETTTVADLAGRES
jgi:Rrf2 family protein